jgi:hypothetical protein
MKTDETTAEIINVMSRMNRLGRLQLLGMAKVLASRFPACGATVIAFPNRRTDRPREPHERA